MEMLKLLACHKFNAFRNFIQLLSEFQVFFVHIAYLASILAYSDTIALYTLPFSAKPYHFQIRRMRDRLLGHSVYTSGHISRIGSRAASTSPLRSLLPLLSGLFRLESSHEVIHELFDG